MLPSGAARTPPTALSRRAAPGSLRRLYLAAELVAAFVAFPVGLWFVRRAFAGWIIPTLLVTGAGCGAVLLADPTFRRRRLWNAAQFGGRLRRLLRGFLPAAAALAVVYGAAEPGRFLAFPRQRPGLWLFVMAFYPLVSAYPQELIFRTFFFHRYRPLFGRPTALVWASGLAFGLAHLFFGTWIAPTLSAVGGILFAHTYARTGSTLQATLQHALWGDFLFTLGLGWYFYGGSIAG